MANIKFSLKHKTNFDAVVDLIKDEYGFEPCEEWDNLYVKTIQGWETKVRPLKDELVFFIFKPKEKISETYFDHLLYVGYLMGEVKNDLEKLPIQEDPDDDAPSDLDYDDMVIDVGEEG